MDGEGALSEAARQPLSEQAPVEDNAIVDLGNEDFSKLNVQETTEEVTQGSLAPTASSISSIASNTPLSAPATIAPSSTASTSSVANDSVAHHDVPTSPKPYLKMGKWEPQIEDDHSAFRFGSFGTFEEPVKSSASWTAGTEIGAVGEQSEPLVSGWNGGSAAEAEGSSTAPTAAESQIRIEVSSPPCT